MRGEATLWDSAWVAEVFSVVLVHFVSTLSRNDALCVAAAVAFVQLARLSQLLGPLNALRVHAAHRRYAVSENRSPAALQTLQAQYHGATRNLSAHIAGLSLSVLMNAQLYSVLLPEWAQPALAPAETPDARNTRVLVELGGAFAFYVVLGVGFMAAHVWHVDDGGGGGGAHAYGGAHVALVFLFARLGVSPYACAHNVWMAILEPLLCRALLEHTRVVYAPLLKKLCSVEVAYTGRTRLTTVPPGARRAQTGRHAAAADAVLGAPARA